MFNSTISIVDVFVQKSWPISSEPSEEKKLCQSSNYSRIVLENERDDSSFSTFN